MFRYTVWCAECRKELVHVESRRPYTTAVQPPHAHRCEPCKAGVPPHADTAARQAVLNLERALETCWSVAQRQRVLAEVEVVFDVGYEAGRSNGILEG